jgi:hypothetical protein
VVRSVTNTPKVSVLLPVHNGMKHLPLAVESVLAQTFRDFELHVIDNASTDGVREYARSIADPRVRFHHLDEANLVGALNFGLREARADLVARIDHDDLCRRDRVEKQIARMQARPDCVLLGCRAVVIDLEGRPIGMCSHPLSDASLRWQMLFGNPFHHMGVMFRRRPVLELGGYSPEFDVAEDYDLWTRLAAKGEIANLPERLIERRLHAASISLRHRERQHRQIGLIASAYAQTILPSADFDTMLRLNQLLLFGVIPPPREFAAMAALFNQLARHVAAVQPDLGDSELVELIATHRADLRWACTQLMRRRAHRPWDALRLLLALRELDGGGLTKLVARTLAKKIVRRTAVSASG